MARRGENIYHRKDGRWEGRYKIGWDNQGKRKYGYIYGKSYSEVKQKMSEIDKDNLSKDILMKDLIDCWLRKKEGEVKRDLVARVLSLFCRDIWTWNCPSELS